jgi:hypothetical protein
MNDQPARGLKLWTDRIRHRARSLIGQYPSLYMPLARWNHRRHARVRGLDHKRPRYVERDTDVVIEGFLRSGNTFATTAFQLAQPNPIRIADHRHVPAHVIAATKFGIPTLVLLRDPEETVLSLALWMPHITLKQALRDYVRFYRRIVSYRDSFVVARFDDVTSDFGAVIRQLNARFGTSFEEFQHTSENVARCFEIMEDAKLKKHGSIDETRISRPSGERETMKNEIRAAFRSPRLQRLRVDAYSLYETLSSRRGLSLGGSRS